MPSKPTQRKKAAAKEGANRRRGNRTPTPTASQSSEAQESRTTDQLTAPVASENTNPVSMLRLIAPSVKSVQGDALMKRIYSWATKYLAVGEAERIAITLWIIHSYTYDCGNFSPILAIVSPEKRSGKTTVLTLLDGLTRNALIVANMTEASLFRFIEKQQPTLLIDEADTWLRGRSEFRGILNAGHNRRSAYVIRCGTKDQGFEPQKFLVWAPKAIAMIGQLDDTLSDRSIRIEMRRRQTRPANQSIPLSAVDDGEFFPIRGQIARWAIDHFPDIRAANPRIPDELHDRAADNWRPLLAIAEIVGGEWPLRARKAAVALSDGIEEESPQMMLLSDLQDILEEMSDGRIATSDLINRLVSREDRPWGQFSGGRRLTPYDLAKLVRIWGVPGPKKFRVVGKSPVRGYELAQFKPLFESYLRQRREPAERMEQGTVPSVPDVPISLEQEPTILRRKPSRTLSRKAQ